eukprot:829123-Rhodomonas_salina.2
MSRASNHSAGASGPDFGCVCLKSLWSMCSRIGNCEPVSLGGTGFEGCKNWSMGVGEVGMRDSESRRDTGELKGCVEGCWRLSTAHASRTGARAAVSFGVLQMQTQQRDRGAPLVHAYMHSA